MAHEFYTDRLKNDDAASVTIRFTTNAEDDCASCFRRERDEATVQHSAVFQTQQDGKSRELTAFCDTAMREERGCGLGAFTTRIVGSPTR